jgi:ABC-type Fe3+/spermidine/putrescine transport system ATPase subunit
VMFAGRIAQVAAPETIYDRPANRAVATFVGQANILSCTIEANGALRTAGGSAPRPEGLSAAPGTTVDLMARPEAIGLVAAGDPAAHLTGEVTARYFHGSFVDYRVAVADTVIAVQMVPPARFQVGDAVGLVLDAARLWPLGEAE